MKLIIIIMAFCVLNLYSIDKNITSNQYNYQRSYYYEGIYIDDNTEYENVHLIANLDFRYVNQLIIENKFNEVNKLYNKYLELEKQLKFNERYRLYSYIINERNALNNSDFNWIYSTVEEAVNAIKASLEIKSFNSNIFPPSIIRGGLYYIHSETMSNHNASLYLNEKLNFNNLEYGGYIEANEGYVISVNSVGKSRPEYFFYLKKVKSKIYPELNDSFELSAFFYPGGEAEAKWYSTWVGSTIEKDFIYGTIDLIEPYKIDDECLSISENLNIFEKQDSSSMILNTIKKNTVMKVVQIGKYEVIDGKGANWIKISIDDYTGWCFGSFTNITRNYVDTTGIVM